jgi:3-dehydroquinate synthase
MTNHPLVIDGIHPTVILPKTEVLDYVQTEIKKVSRSQVFTIIDEQVARLYPEWTSIYPCIRVSAGEACKDLSVVQEVVHTLLEKGADRQSFILGVGGGSLSDLCGFIASIFMRGIPFAFVPSTLLSMTDASLGGKNGVNFGGFKNVLGIIRQPEFVTISPHFVQTLDERSYRSGFAEVIKHACLSGAPFLQFLENNNASLLQQDLSKLSDLLQRSIAVKMKIVNEDEFESGARKKLNLGHTIGHALEVMYPFTHGESISIGMVLAAKIGERIHKTVNGYSSQIASLCNAYNLPVSCDFKTDKIIEKILADKKRVLEQVRFILPIKPGDVEIVNISLADITLHLNELESK